MDSVVVTPEQKLAAEQFKADVEVIVGSPAGKRFVAWILSEGHILSTCYTGNMVGTFMQGEQNLALKVLGAVRQYVPDALFQVLPPVPDAKPLKAATADSNSASVI